MGVINERDADFPPHVLDAPSPYQIIFLRRGVWGKLAEIDSNRLGLHAVNVLNGKYLLSSESSEDEDVETRVQNGNLQVNTDYARRFEHNKKREELQRLEEKIGKSSHKRKRAEGDEQSSTSEDESTSESEDEGELATEALDSEIIATLNAIKSKDPRVYDKTTTFYTNNDTNDAETSKVKKEKSMNLQDYHRRNLLNGAGEEEDRSLPMTYNEEQEQLKQSILGEIRAAVDGETSEESDEEAYDDKFLVAKQKQKQHKSESVILDVESADKDPETFLSNFMSSRAWASNTSNLHPFESDDEEEERRADEFEEAYNFRFEDPNKSNEKLNSHARDLATKYSVRRDEDNPRKRKREDEKKQKESAKQQHREEKARLKKLRMDEVEEKIRKFRRTAGLKNADIRPEDWARFVNDDWDDQKWEEEMKKRFGEEYYAEDDVESDNEQATGKTRKTRKPKFDDDIDIKDLVPDFDDNEKPQFTLSDDEPEAPEDEDGKGTPNHQKQTKSKVRRDAKKERKLVEQLVEDQMEIELANGENNTSKAAGFRYRETSPKSFGLTAKDILMAEDTQLNQYAGLKKLAAFRDPEKKRKDSKHLGKRARLRKWRQETFGDENGPRDHDVDNVQTQQPKFDSERGNGENDIKVNGKEKKRRRKKKFQRVE